MKAKTPKAPKKLKSPIYGTKTRWTSAMRRDLAGIWIQVQWSDVSQKDSGICFFTSDLDAKILTRAGEVMSFDGPSQIVKSYAFKITVV